MSSIAENKQLSFPQTVGAEFTSDMQKVLDSHHLFGTNIQCTRLTRNACPDGFKFAQKNCGTCRFAAVDQVAVKTWLEEQKFEVTTYVPNSEVIYLWGRDSEGNTVEFRHSRGRVGFSRIIESIKG